MSSKKVQTTIQSYGLITFCSRRRKKGKEDTVIIQSRRNSYAFIEFMTGKVQENKLGYCFEQMTNYEKDLLSKDREFDDLWKDLWAGENYFVDTYSSAKKFYEKIRQRIGILLSSKKTDIENYWGFAKGKKEKNETPKDAAIREFEEEVGISTTSFEIHPEETIQHTYRGTNGRNYSTLYFIASSPEEYPIAYKNFPGCIRESSVSNEVQDAEWKTIEEARGLIEWNLQKVLDEAYLKYKAWKP